MTSTQPRQIEGFWNIIPKIKNISFPTDSVFQVSLEDGRIITVPLDKFPSIQQLTPNQRLHWYKFGNGFSFDDSDEIIHLEQVLGNFDTYRHENPVA